MRTTKLDRRSQRTRQLLNTALRELIIERRYDTITVQDIIDRANVGRSTFYAHYYDKEDLLVSEFTHMLDALSQQLTQHPPHQQLFPSLAPFFQHVQEQHQLHKALVRSGAVLDLIYQTAQARLRQNIEQQLHLLLPAEHSPAIPLPLVADYMVGTVLTLLRWWLDHEMPYTPEQMDAMFHQLVLPGVRATLRI